MIATNVTYNAQGLVDSVSGSSVYVQSTTYDALGRVELRVLGNDVLRRDPVYYPWTTANGRGRLQQLKAGTPSNPTSLQDLRYTYDAVGNVVSIQDWKAGSPQTHSFSYDDLDRLTYASVSGGSGGLYSESVSYKKDGNIESKGGLYYTYDPNHAHAVKEVVEPLFGSTVHSFGYDANGNMTSRTISGEGTYSLTYDGENRLVGVSGAASASLVYDGDGNRVKATFGSTTIVYVGDYYEQEGGTVRKYYYAAGERVAMREGSTLYWLLADHLGSTAITAYSGGSKKAELRYRAWGETRYSWGTPPPTYRFTGQWEDGTMVKAW